MFFKRPREQTLQDADPYRFAKNPHKPVGRRLSPAAFKPSPLGKGDRARGG